MGRRTLITVIAVIGLVSVRLMAPHIFYDPLIHFFHQLDYQVTDLPEVNKFKFTFSLLLRFLLNTALTLVIVNEVFQKKDLLRLTIAILTITFVVLTPILLVLIHNGNQEHYQYLFYVRRLLIHPVLTLILIPAYLYHQRTFKTNNDD